MSGKTYTKWEQLRTSESSENFEEKFEPGPAWTSTSSMLLRRGISELDAALVRKDEDIKIVCIHFYHLSTLYIFAHSWTNMYFYKCPVCADAGDLSSTEVLHSLQKLLQRKPFETFTSKACFKHTLSLPKLFRSFLTCTGWNRRRRHLCCSHSRSSSMPLCFHTMSWSCNSSSITRSIAYHCIISSWKRCGCVGELPSDPAEALRPQRSTWQTLRAKQFRQICLGDFGQILRSSSAILAKDE